MDLTFRDMNLRIFCGDPVPHVLFQPRFEPWFDWHTQFESLPPQLEGMTIEQVYDKIGASMRYVHYYTGQPDPVMGHFSPEVKVTEKREGDLLHRCYETPHGELWETSKFTVDKTWRVVEFAAKKAEDLPALKWLLAHRILNFNTENFHIGDQYIGERGVPQFWVPKSPYFALAQQWMRYEDFVYALYDQPQAIEDIMAVIDESYDPL